jgi:carboxyl-terminal processing protease
MEYCDRDDGDPKNTGSSERGEEQSANRSAPRARKAWRQILISVLLVVLVIFTGINIIIYTNYNNLGKLFRVLMNIHEHYVDEVPLSELVDGAINGMVEALDPYSSYQSADESAVFMQELSGRIGGIGILISSADPSKLVVVKVFSGSPAERAALLPGDVLIGADGQNLADINQDEAINLIRGEPGTDVTLDILRNDESKTFSVTLQREYIVVPSVEGRELPGHPALALIAVSSFTEQTGDEFANVLREIDMPNKDGLILDLRYNPGGEVRSALKAAGFLVPGREIFYVVDRSGKETAEISDSPYMSKPLVVLVNEYSASAAEIVAGAVKDYGSGKIVGVKTYGKGVMQTVYHVDNSNLVLTTNKYLTPGRNDIHGNGIEPDVTVELNPGEAVTVMPEEEPFDSQLQEAVRVLLELTAEP